MLKPSYTNDSGNSILVSLAKKRKRQSRKGEMSQSTHMNRGDNGQSEMFTSIIDAVNAELGGRWTMNCLLLPPINGSEDTSALGMLLTRLGNYMQPGCGVHLTMQPPFVPPPHHQ